MRYKNLCWFAICFSISLHAADGVLEINQACALDGGCFPDDTPGFPVEIHHPGSYRLTGNLDLSAIPATNAINIISQYVTLDLGGFEIVGAASCTGTGATLMCSPSGSADGVFINADHAVVRNGTVRNFDHDGVGADEKSSHIEDIVARHNSHGGIWVLDNSRVSDSQARENLVAGVRVGAHSLVKDTIAASNGNTGIRGSGTHVVVQASSSNGNGGAGFSLQPNSKYGRNVSSQNGLADSCGGGICTERKRFYLTQSTHQGSDVLSSCAMGFHMASFFEIQDVTALQYDTTLGQNEDDSGTGPPTHIDGWLRSGSFSFDATNCELWTSNDGAHSGSGGRLLTAGEWNSAAVAGSPWEQTGGGCSDPRPVWCAED